MDTDSDTEVTSATTVLTEETIEKKASMNVFLTLETLKRKLYDEKRRTAVQAQKIYQLEKELVREREGKRNHKETQRMLSEVFRHVAPKKETTKLDEFNKLRKLTENKKRPRDHIVANTIA